MSASDIGKRTKHHLQQASLSAGKSCHGFRRGRMQSMAAAGMSNVDIGHKVQINTVEIVDRYLDLTRHFPRLHGLASE